MADVELKRKVTLKRKGESDSSKKPQPSKSKWWLWLLLLTAVAVGAIFFLKGYSSRSDRPETQSNTEDTIAPETAETEPVDTEPAETETAPAPEVNPDAEPQNSQPIATPDTESTPISTPLQGTIEEKAWRVIRGDFGNGLDRKQKLGSEYQTIQRRVNEMYRDGTVQL